MTFEGLELDPCVHGEQNRLLCAICKDKEPKSRKTVYFTSGGQHFHYSAFCISLADGQRIVLDRGGTPGMIESGYQDILQISRKPCKTCVTL